MYTLFSSTWDIDYVGDTLTFRNRPRDVFSSIRFLADTETMELRGSFNLTNRVKIQITDAGIFANGMLLAESNIIISSKSALSITDSPIKDDRAFSREICRCFVDELPGIAILNSVRCSRNAVRKCQDAFVWTTEFLETLCARRDHDA